MAMTHKNNPKRPGLIALAAFAAALYPAFPAHALESGHTIEISRPDDLELNCPALSREHGIMRDTVAAAHATEENATLRSQGVGAAGMAASYLVGSLTGTIGIMAAGHLIREATDDDGEDAAKREDRAKQRRSFIAGLYQARGCVGPLQPLPPEPESSLLDMPDIEPAAGQVERTPRYND